MTALHNPAHPDYNLKTSLEWSRNLFEKALAEAEKAEWQDAPFPCDQAQAAVYHGVRKDLLVWVLEMLPAKDSSGYLEPAG